MATLSEIQTLTLECIRLLADDFQLEALQAPQLDSPLYGTGGTLDSMALVNLIADLEDAVSEQWGQSITLADEKAMSAKNSPYRTAETLSLAIQERLES
ncbi:hypothetical protein [Coraliomargarita parva]|uniref:hypothetical protein n=1 Tax=Coraliomargarita parva TaxID=3014050 RepID=UPI0022B3FE3F|nr:hypothetical protein [Coraliomargarita parva]